MSDPATPLAAPQPPAPAPDATATRLSTTWLLKQGVFLVVLVVLGVWGLADALHFYPRRGLEDASFKLHNYLDAANRANRLVPADVRIEDPAAELERMKPKAEQIHKAAAAGGADMASRLANMELAKLKWLESLERVWRLGPEPMVVISPGQLPADFPGSATRTVRYDPKGGVGLATAAPGAAVEEIAPDRLHRELVLKWGSRNQVTPLSGYDMILQWVFVVLGLGGGAWVLATMLRAAAKRFRWEPASQTLTLPGGRRIAPGDIKEFDKRRWHKFYVTLHLHDGAAHTLDLLRHVPLEEWVLSMEKTAFPHEGGAAASAAPAPEPAGNEPAAAPNNVA